MREGPGRGAPTMRAANRSAGACAQHPRSQGGGAPGAGLITPLPNGARGRPIARAAQRGLASPWRLPALHSPFRGTEKGNRPTPRLQRTGAAERWLRGLFEKIECGRARELSKFLTVLRKRKDPVHTKSASISGCPAGACTPRRWMRGRTAAEYAGLLLTPERPLIAPAVGERLIGDARVVGAIGQFVRRSRRRRRRSPRCPDRRSASGRCAR